jgi:hypothetical protein
LTDSHELDGQECKLLIATRPRPSQHAHGFLVLTSTETRELHRRLDRGIFLGVALVELVVSAHINVGFLPIDERGAVGEQLRDFGTLAQCHPMSLLDRSIPYLFAARKFLHCPAFVSYHYYGRRASIADAPICIVRDGLRTIAAERGNLEVDSAWSGNGGCLPATHCWQCGLNRLLCRLLLL